ncbi:RNA polymerase sigma factor [Asanoa siamensis]|uniref:Siderophore-interacting protein n=1 Tax=Asanoa siamensis TaxID=926357 RepID=A0ABQ4CVG5_9ACTN|nr:sigma-70 family RNA polymerase sigma factor [Asanoa siamensis]GIF75287.1 siderophore-interacting protein [Asanoa siamensis]
MPEPEQVDRFTTLYQTHYRQVYAYAVTRAGRQLADDVVADVFLVAWRRFAAIPRAAPLPWLLAVARNVIRERFREEVRRHAVTAEMQAWLETTDEIVADVADGVAERAAVLTALTRLSEEDRELLTLIAWNGLSPGQAARVLGCSTATYFVRLHRARKRLTAGIAAVTEPTLSRTSGSPLRLKESKR